MQVGRTPLMIACDHGYEKLGEMLIDAGADINILKKVSVFLLNEFLF